MPPTVETLPAAARRWLDRASPTGRTPATTISLRQSGSLEANGRWLDFGADATYHPDPFRFDWRARLRVMPGMWVNAVDGHDDENGWGGSKLWGIRSMGERSGPDVHVMQLTRSIAELAWLPDLAEAATSLEWVDAGPDAFEVRGRAGERIVDVRFDIDATGEITRARSEARPFDVPEGFEEAPWRLDYADPDVIGGVRIPTRVKATYEHREGEWEYFRAEIVGREAG